MWSNIVVEKGQVLKVGSVVENGSRAYIAFQGGLPQIPLYLGSKSTAPELQFGGLQGRRLQTSDILELSPESATFAADAVPTSIPHDAIPDFGSITEICCLSGPFDSDDILTQEGRDTIFTSQWTVNHNSSRSGVRLNGPRVKWARDRGGGGGSHPSNIFDYGYPNGGVNWTGESPIVLTRDRPDLGGFVCPMTVCSGEMWKVGQLKAGDKARFRLTTFENALKISLAKHSYLREISAYIQSKTDLAIPSLRLDLSHQPTPLILKRKPATSNHPQVTFRQAGDTSIIVEYGKQIADLRNTVCVKLLSEELEKQDFKDIRYEPNIATLTVHFNPMQLSQLGLLRLLDGLDAQIADTTGLQLSVREVHLPLCLDHLSLQEATQRYMDSIRPTAAYLPDNIDYLREANALPSRKDVFDALLKTPWLAVAVGFYVGTPIMFPLDPHYLYTGQKYGPNRTYTPSGSVGLGGSLLGLYPIALPGGYQLMGRTLGAWDTAGTRPCFSSQRPWLFDLWDIVRFQQVTEEEFNQFEREFKAGRYHFRITTTTLNLDHYIYKFDAAFVDPTYCDWQRRQALAAEEMNTLEQRLFEEWNIAEAAGARQDANDEIDGVSPTNMVKIIAPVDANVWKIQVQVGDVLRKGEVIAILEAMKMEIKVAVADDQDGARVTSIACRPGSVVGPDTTILMAMHDT
ncbi:unnamed protein product [Penicillium salamii]|uniref:Urea carboxylase n=1 Tax=Penicillium salamii TaxID=1612424 RepID=A0A9W4NG97_9EURO|nr:unnamed protein product [Penicillium salamii]